MRKSFTGLISIVQHELDSDPLSGDLYVFLNRSGKYLKAIFWDRTGHCIISKKLETKSISASLRLEKRELKEEQLKLLFDGVSV